MSLIRVNVNSKLWCFYWTCLVIVSDYVTDVGGYWLGNRKYVNHVEFSWFYNQFLKIFSNFDNDWNTIQTWCQVEHWSQNDSNWFPGKMVEKLTGL